MTYHVRIARSAVRALAKLPRWAQTRIAAAINHLADDPRPPGTKRLATADPTHWIRLGDYRVICEIDDDARTITILGISHRRDVYRGL